MISTKNAVKTGCFYRNLFLSLFLLITSNVYQISAQSQCSSSSMMLVGATKFDCTYDYGPGQETHEIDRIKYYGPSGASLSTTLTWASTTSANVGNAGYYAMVKNPADVTGKGYPNINESMMIVRWPGANTSMATLSVAGLNPGAPIQVKIWGYYLADFSCSQWDSPVIAFGINNSLTDVTLTGSGRLKGNAFSATLTTNLAAGTTSANVDIKSSYYPYNCGVLGITKIEIWSCPDIQIISSESEEMCTGEQTHLFLDRDYATSSFKWEKSTTSATSGFTEIPNTAGAASILEEVTQDAWYRCTVSGVTSKALLIKTITCCLPPMRWDTANPPHTTIATGLLPRLTNSAQSRALFTTRLACVSQRLTR